MTPAEAKDYIRLQLIAPRNVAQEFLSFDAIIDLISQSITTGIPTWAVALTFNNNGTGIGAFCTFADTNGRLRFWKSKTNANTGNQPPSSPIIITNTFWDEVSPSSGSAIQEWAAGIYGDGLVIVYFDLSGNGTNPALYLLKEATRPFQSTNLVTEIGTGKWVQLSPPGQIPLAAISTAAAIISLDMLGNGQMYMRGTANITAAKQWQKTGVASARRLDFFFNITGSFAQTMDSDVRMKINGSAGTWDSTAKTWTPDYAGDYQATLYYDSNHWKLQIEGPFV